MRYGELVAEALRGNPETAAALAGWTLIGEAMLDLRALARSAAANG